MPKLKQILWIVAFRRKGNAKWEFGEKGAGTRLRARFIAKELSPMYPSYQFRVMKVEVREL